MSFPSAVTPSIPNSYVPGPTLFSGSALNASVRVFPSGTATPVTVKLVGGENVRGWVEYYDQNMIRLTREGAPNLFIFKHEILYIAEDGGRRKRE